MILQPQGSTPNSVSPSPRAAQTLKVLANLCFVVPDQVGGSEEYAVRLLKAVTSDAAFKDVSSRKQVSLRLELAAMKKTREYHPDLSDIVWHEAPWSGHNRLRRVAVESTWLFHRSSGFDIVHHFGGRIPALHRGVTVVTIHDLQPLDIPENFSAAKRHYLKMALKHSSRAADLVVVPSKWVAERVEQHLKVPADHIRVVSSTYPQQLFDQLDSRKDRSRRINLQKKLFKASDTEDGTWNDKPFVLYPAATYPHKNHALLIAAHSIVRTRVKDATLILTGGNGRAHSKVNELVEQSPGVVHLGRCNRKLLASLYFSAAAVAFPSRYEGFGLPVLEAMAAGTPVIAANTTALPEIVGDAGMLVDPDDLDGWVDAMIEALNRSRDIDKRVEKARTRAALYSPVKAAARLTEVWTRL